MSINHDVPDSLRGLAVLGRRDDLNVRPVLLRVMTDLFVMKAHHIPEETLQFEELALHMLDDVDDETRAAIAGKLATYGATPPAAVIDRLVAFGGRPAAVLLEKSDSVADHAIVRAALHGEAELAAAVARRRDLGPEVVQTLVAREESEVLVALAENRSAVLSRQSFVSLVRRARRDASLACALLSRAEDADDVAPLFLSASPDQRAAIVLAAKRRALGRAPQASTPPDVSLLERLEKLASQPNRRLFAAALAAATGAGAEDMNLVVGDRYGEPLALVLAGLGMTPAAATRIFLAGDPAIAHSYPRIAALRQLVEHISPPTARRLVARFLDIARQRPSYVGATDSTANAIPSRSGRISSHVPRDAPSSDARRRRFTDGNHR
jgi:uncharacterized protein (DUF2336 family)